MYVCYSAKEDFLNSLETLETLNIASSERTSLLNELIDSAESVPIGKLMSLEKIDFENDVVLVREYCASTNTLVYEGNAIPSSDSVEASIVFNHHPSVSQLVHTHDSRRFTRNDKVLSTHPSQAQALPYGEVELGYEMARLLTGRGGDLIILLEHGEVFTGSREIPVSASIDYWISFYS